MTHTEAAEAMIAYLKPLQVELRRRSIELIVNKGVTRV